jgi:hypothetical protein
VTYSGRSMTGLQSGPRNLAYEALLLFETAPEPRRIRMICDEIEFETMPDGGPS